MISSRCACTSAAARRLALCSGRSVIAPGTAGKAGGSGTSGTAPLLQLTHRALRTRSSPYHLRSANSSSRRVLAQVRRQQQASTLSGDKLVPPRATTTTLATGEKAAASTTKNKAVAAWLFGTAGAVAVMVTVGGITRMTKSGLSMTDWKIQGSLPPSSEVIVSEVYSDAGWCTRPSMCKSMRLSQQSPALSCCRYDSLQLMLSICLVSL